MKRVNVNLSVLPATDGPADGEAAKGEPEAVWLSAKSTWTRYNTTSMSLWRWLKDPALGFPRPIFIGRFRYFKLSELEAFDREREAERDRERAA